MGVCVAALWLGALAAPARASAGEPQAWIQSEYTKLRLFAHLDRAFRLKGEGRLAEARQEFERCLEIDGQHREAWANYLEVLVQLGDRRALLDRSTPLLDRGELAALALPLRWRAAAELNDVEATWREVQRLPANSPELGPAAVAVLNLAMKQKRDDLVVTSVARIPAAERTSMHQALAADAQRRLNGGAGSFGSSAPRSLAEQLYDRHMTQGYALMQQRRFDQAAQAFATAVRLRAEPTAMAAAGRAEAAAGRAPAAIDWLLRAFEKAPSAQLALELGLLYANERDAARSSSYLERIRPETLSAASRSVLQTQLAHNYLAVGRLADARDMFASALQEAPDDPRLLVAAGTTLASLGDPAAARTRLDAAMAAIEDDGKGDPVLAGLTADGFERSGAWAEAARAHRLYATRLPHPSVEAARAYERAAYAQLKLEALDEAVADFRRAAGQGSLAPGARLDLALTLFRLGRWEETTREALALLETGSNARAHLVAARAFARLDKPGLSVLHLEAAAPGDLAPEERKILQDELSFLLLDAGEYARAIAACQASLAIAADPAISVRLSRAHRLTGSWRQGLEALKEIDEAGLPPATRLALVDERAALLEQGEQYRDAAADLAAAVQLEPSADRHHRLGNLLSRAGKHVEAIPHLEAAANLEGANRTYVASLGYALLKAGRRREALARLEALAVADRDNVAVREDLAFAAIAEGDERAAVRWLDEALDGHTRLTVEDATGQATQARRRRVRQLRESRAHVVGAPALQTFFGYHALPTPSATNVAPADSWSLVSQAGFEYTQRLPQGGSNTWERPLNVIVRGFSGWPFPAASSGSSTLSQLGVGVRYKPLRSQNIGVSFERFVQFGQGTSGAWLARTSFSHEHGGRIREGERWSPYSSSFLDAAGFFGSGRAALFSGESRVGIARNLHDRWLVTPHVMGTGHRYDAAVDAGVLEAGVGLGLKYFMPESASLALPSAAELRVYYRVGRAWSGTLRNTYRTVAFTTAVSF